MPQPLAAQAPPHAHARALGADHILRQSAAAATGLMLLAQHAAPAAGDLFVSRALLAAGRGQSPAANLAGFVAAQAVHLAAGPLSSLFASRWATAANRHFVAAALDAHAGRVPLWLAGRSDVPAATQRVAHDTPWVAGLLVGLGRQGGALGIALATQAAVLATLVDARLAQVFAACCVVGYLSGLAAAQLVAWRVAVTTHPLGDPHFRYGAQRERMWDNTTLGNRVNFDRWYAGLAGAQRGYAAEGVVHASLGAGCSALGQLTAATLFGLSLYARAEHLWAEGDQEALAAFFLPMAARTLRTLGTLNEAGLWFAELSRGRRILTRLRGEMLAEPVLQPAARVGTALHVAGPQGQALAPLSLIEALPGSGRHTVRGPNGAGKTMLMAAIKAAHGPRVFLWPASHDLMFGELPVGSSGQTALRALEALEGDLERYPQIDTLLLDEWDANLDADHKARMSARIDALSRRYAIIEVTHRAAGAAHEA